MIERLPTGVRGLDEILGSGLPANAINLVLGLPGTGKTLLAQQVIFHNATDERPALYLSTVSEPFDKLIRYGQRLSFFETEAVGRRVFYDDLGSTLLADGLGMVAERVKRLLDTYEPGVLVIDSFKPLSAFAESETDYRHFLHVLAGRLSVRPLTSIWVGEHSTSDLLSAPEFAVADAVIWLAAARREEREMRLLQVLKLRGSDYLSGRHAYRLSGDGMRVFPRLADSGTSGRYELEQQTVSTGIDTLDAILHDGYRRGSATLVVGPSGIGKTVMGLQFVCARGRRQAHSVFATLEENPSQLARAAASLGWSLEESGVRLMYRSAVDLYLDEWIYELLELLKSSKAARVFIDGLGNLRAAAADPVRFTEYLYSFIQRCSRNGVTLMMSLESPELFGVTRLGELSLSQMADNVVVLQFLQRDREYRRGMTFIKGRATAIEPRTWEYTISSGGIALVHGEPRDHRARRTSHT